MRKQRFGIIAGVVVLFLVGMLLLVGHVVQMRERRIPVGRDTTFVMGPVDAEGYVDYVAAVNAEFSEGVTSENNAAVVLLRATGMDDVAPAQRAGFLRGLGVKEMVAVGKRGPTLADVMKGREGESESDRMDRVNDAEDARTKKVWKAEEDREAAEWVARNEEALLLVKQASLRERCFEPLIDEDGRGSILQVTFVELRGKRELANVLAARAMMRLGAGDMAGWREDVMTMERYGRLVMQEPALIQRLVGMAILAQADACIWAGLSRMSAAEAGEMLKELRGMPAVPELAEAVDKLERLLPLAELSALAKYGNSWAKPASMRVAGGTLGDGVEPVDFAGAMWDSNRLWDMAVAGMREKTYAGMKSAAIAFGSEKERIRKEWSGIIHLGMDRAVVEIIMLMATDFSSAGKLEQESRIRRGMAEVGLVLATDRGTRGAYAARLEDLPAAEVAGRDEDFFSGGKLVYRREGNGYVLYSVGRNGRDDGGVREAPKARFMMDEATRAAQEAERKDDVVLRVE
jgi:hypothetical protein